MKHVIAHATHTELLKEIQCQGLDFYLLGWKLDGSLFLGGSWIFVVVVVSFLGGGGGGGGELYLQLKEFHTQKITHLIKVSGAMQVAQ